MQAMLPSTCKPHLALGLQVHVSLITAGAPRVFDTKFAGQVKAWHTDPQQAFQFFRFVHARDPVPSLPPQDWRCATRLVFVMPDIVIQTKADAPSDYHAEAMCVHHEPRVLIFGDHPGTMHVVRK